MPIMEISIIPLGTKTASVSKYVARSIEVLRKEKGMKYKLTSMGTIIEADTVERLLDIAGKMHNAVLNNKMKRIVTTMKIDDRRDKKLTMAKKIKSVRKKLRF